MNVVIVESPAKAKTINKYLGSDYTVIASYGHVRDLPAKDGSVLPDEDFAMAWEVEDRGAKRISDIAKAVKGSSRVFLATDPDREGEAISWHVLQCLNDRKVLKGVDVKRVVFHEITKAAVLHAVANPRDINQELVDAYLARRALDYLVGFTLSPVLWRKLPGSRSAGRVQSVALRLICERESEIEVFKTDEYWSVDIDFLTAKSENFTARLTHLNGKKLDKLTLGEKGAADAAVAVVNAAQFRVASVEKKQSKRHPAPPFITSTLQQEASRKLGFGAQQTMRIAQKLYEGIELGGETVGLISYMRTDSVTLSGEAIGGCRRLIAQDYGDSYLPSSPRAYKSKSANAQEAHEAIRPTDLFRRPKDMARYLDQDQARLYELIWKRTIACQMESAVLDQVAADLKAQDGSAQARANGSTILFDGFLKLYLEGRDDAEDEESGMLPPLTEGDGVKRLDTRPEQHFTQPPPRYSEASLVKKLEELGIGRPSTYASIIQVLQDRNYVTLEQKRFVPEDRGRLVTSFLASFFDRYVEYDFTANLENQLDDISAGRIDWRAVLRAFWEPFIKAVDGTKYLTITQVIDTLDAALGDHFFPDRGDGKNPRACPACTEGRLGLRLGRTGGFIGCSNYPECRYTRALAIEGGDGEADGELAGPKLLGDDPATGLPITLRKGPYGIYVQLGEGDKENKPKRASLPAGVKPADVDLDRAISMLALPRSIGKHPETGDELTAGVGRFGPYIKHGKAYTSLPKGEDVLSIGLNRAVVVLAEAAERAKNRAVKDPGKPLGPHPGGIGDIALHDGKYGPYVEVNGVRQTVPKNIDPATLTADQAAALLAPKLLEAEKSGKSKAKPKAKAATASKAKAPAKTAAAKAPAKAKAPAAKKTTKAATADEGDAPAKTTPTRARRTKPAPVAE
ncbi:type I DNA topoisomerase [Elstera sp.]|jgi:DNA topoisomerase-1|uniref:type I DNA topoisomerase n=1 Tax=Elstera sp. TaxID=1916664 RepID=UPI0037C1AA11